MQNMKESFLQAKKELDKLHDDVTIIFIYSLR